MRYLVCLLFLSMVLGVIPLQYGLVINVTDSLPHTVYLWEKAVPKEIQRGEYVVFQSSFKKEPLTKQITGLPGDQIRSWNRAVLVNQVKVGVARRKRSNGEPLEVIQSQTIPENCYFVSGSHEKSFDSRYQEFGLVSQDRILGKAIPLC